MDNSVHLERIISDLVTERSLVISREEVAWLCKGAMEIMLAEPSLIEIDPPVHICGDLHGQFNDLLRVLQTGGLNSEVKYLFLGDYVDRGDQSMEVICLLFALKMRFPSNVFLLRGNHESPEMTEAFGFAEECEAKLDFLMLPMFFDAFDALPIAARVGGRIFCVHGGLSPSLQYIDEIKAIERPATVPEEGILADLLWSDPSPSTVEWGPNERGATYTWGWKTANEFMKRNGIDRIVRAHQMAYDGYDFPFAPEEAIITVFTASSYANRFTNRAAFLTVNERLQLRFTVLEPITSDGLAQTTRTDEEELYDTELTIDSDHCAVDAQ